MSICYDVLTLGESEVYLNDQHMGLAAEVRLHKLVERITVERPEGGELTARKLIPLRRSFSIELKLKELAPAAFSFFTGDGGSAYFAVANHGMRDYLRLFPDRPTKLRHLPATTPSVKSADGSITYAVGVDFQEDWLNGRFSLLPESSIAPGQLLRVDYTADFPAGREVVLAEQTPTTAVMEILHRYPDGESFLSLVLRKVELDGSGLLALEAEDLISVPLAGRCLADENYPASPFGYARFYSTMMAQMENRP